MQWQCCTEPTFWQFAVEETLQRSRRVAYASSIQQPRLRYELLFETTVLTVKMNRERLVVALQNKIHVFDLDTMTALHMLKTPPNVEGLLALQPDTSDAQVKERRRGVFSSVSWGHI